MSKPDLAVIRARDKRGALGLSLLRVADEGLLDRKALLAYVEQLESDLDAAAYRAGVAQGRIGQLQTQIERVRDLHRRAHAVNIWQSGVRYEDPCPDCDGKAGVHDCGCWADSDIQFVCAECHRLGSASMGVYDYLYPCPTIEALGGDGE